MTTPTPVQPEHPRLRAWQGWAMLAALLVLALVFAFRRPLADRLWPEARSQALRDQAAVALAQGRLSADDGSGARELYAAALAIDPDRIDSRVGLAKVAEAALARARRQVGAEQFVQAHQSLQLARSLSVPRADAEAVEQLLRQREAAHAGIEQLLVRAAAARKAHRLDGADDAALPLYRHVLALQPDRIEALEGREDALSDLLQQARQALRDGDLVDAARMAKAARGYDAGHADLPGIDAALSTAIERSRADADRALRRGRLDLATEAYRRLLQVDAGDAAAQRGLQQVAAAWAARAAREAADFRFADADAALAQARALDPASAAVRDAAREVAHAHRSKARLRGTLSRGERDRRVRVLLQQAQAAQARGDLLDPPGDSAFDKLRAARALSPDDPAVQRAGARLLPVARECFENELRANDLGRARACLDARRALEGEGAGVAQARRRLAQRWLAVGEERLRAGNLAGAQQALASARSIDGDAAGLADFAARLATASGDAR